MNSINFFLCTKVQSKDITTFEKIGNFFLKPAQFLWNGKKIDFIKETVEIKKLYYSENKDNIAIQIDLIYQNRSFLKGVFMTILLVPGIIFAIGFKLYASRYHVREHNNFMKECLMKNQFNVVLTPRGEEAFGKEVTTLIQDLRVVKGLAADHRLFISEIKQLRLYTEAEPRRGDVNAFDINISLLNKIHFLWNLTELDVADHYKISSRLNNSEAGILKDSNLMIISQGVKEKAKSFYAHNLN